MVNCPLSSFAIQLANLKSDKSCLCPSSEYKLKRCMMFCASPPDSEAYFFIKSSAIAGLSMSIRDSSLALLTKDTQRLNLPFILGFEGIASRITRIAAIALESEPSAINFS